MTQITRPDVRRTAPFEVPFTVIDEVVHVLETVAEPWSIEFELGIGRVDQRRLREAVHAAVARHPMARARQLPARRRDRAWRWEIAPEPDLDPVRVLECPDAESLQSARDELYSRPVPLVEAPPFRLWLVRQPSGDRLLLSANHAAFDGFGCLRLLESVARAYRGADDPGPPVGLEEARDIHRLLAAPDAATRRRRYRLLGSKLVDLAVRPARLAPDGGSDRPGYGIHHASLSPEETASLRRDDFTVNDVLLAAITLAIQTWNETHNARGDRIGVLVPVNLRRSDWQKDVVTNLVLDSRVVTKLADRRDPRALLEAISRQTQLIKQGGGAALIEVLDGWRSLPLWTKQPLSSLLWLTGNRVVDTALLSNLGNLGDPPDFGGEGGAVRDAFFSAPARLPCALSIGAVSVRGALHLSYRYRHPVLDRHAAARFDRLFREELAQVAQA